MVDWEGTGSREIARVERQAQRIIHHLVVLGRAFARRDFSSAWAYKGPQKSRPVKQKGAESWTLAVGRGGKGGRSKGFVENFRQGRHCW